MSIEEPYKAGSESSKDLSMQWDEAYRMMCEEHPPEAGAVHEVIDSLIDFTSNNEVTAKDIEDYLTENFNSLSQSQRNFLLVSARTKRHLSK